MAVPSQTPARAFNDLEGSSHGIANIKSPVIAAGVGAGFVGVLLGAFVTYATQSSWVSSASSPAAVPSLGTRSGQSSVVFQASRAAEVLGELTNVEVKAVAEWFVAETGAAPGRNASPACLWLSGPSAVELLRPPKSDTVAYLDGQGPRPSRYARVTSVGPDGVQEYRVGPLENAQVSPEATMSMLTAAGDIPYTKRPTEPHADNELADAVLTRTNLAVAPLLMDAFGPIFEEFDGFDGSEGTASHFLRNDVLSPAGTRHEIVVFQWTPPPPARMEATWLHPLPWTFKLDTSAADSSEWSAFDISFCGQGPWSTVEELAAAHASGDVHVCPFQKMTGTWDVPQRVTPPSARGPIEEHGGVGWGPWTFTLTQRPSTGMALVDVKFNGERILYELSLQDAQAGYSGDRSSQFFYSDASWSLSMLSASLEPGVDCPEGAHYLSAVDWYHMRAGGDAESDPTNPVEEFYPICVFEWEEDHTIWRHMENSDPPEVRGLTRKTLIVRSMCTVANYDYIVDVKFREDGEIDVHTLFAGYIESRYFDPNFNPEEANFSTILRPGLAGPVHSHGVGWKADFDIGGVRENIFKVTSVKSGAIGLTAGSGQPLVSKYLEHRYVEQEGIGVSTFISDPTRPATWIVADRTATSEAGNPRGYAVTLSDFSTVQVLPDDHPFVRAMPYTKYQLALTKYHDEEYRVTSPYIHYDGEETVKNTQDLDRFLSDGESLVDEDLVAWIGLGKEHVVRQEDMPLVSNFGVGFSLKPWNFFEQNIAASPL